MKQMKQFCRVVRDDDGYVDFDTFSLAVDYCAGYVKRGYPEPKIWLMEIPPSGWVS